MKITHLIARIIFLACLAMMFGFAGYDFGSADPFEHLVLRLGEEKTNKFITEAEVKAIVDKTKKENSESMAFPLKSLEETLRKNSFVSDVQVSRDVKGNILVDIRQDHPIARLLPNNGNGAYWGEKNTLMPLSRNYTARVLIISGSGVDKLYTKGFFASKEGKALERFVRFVNEDPFWKLQTAQLEIGPRMEVTLYPQIGKQRFELGDITDFESKLEKVKMFYDLIVPKVGWNKYEWVSVKYDDQIVCK